MSLDDVHRRIAELSANLETLLAESPAAAERLVAADPDANAQAHLLAQARLELAIYEGALNSVVSLFRTSIESHDMVTATHAHDILASMEESLALARATVNELIQHPIASPATPVE